MKRVIPFLLIALLLVLQFLSIPAASAAESDPIYEWVNVLDYGTLNDSGDNFIVWNLAESQTLTFTYDVPFTFVYDHIDMVMYFQDTITNITINGAAVSFQKISEFCYRVYGTVPRATTSSQLTISVTESVTSGSLWFGVLKFYLGANTLVSQSTNCNLNVTGYNLNQTIYFFGSPVSKVIYYSEGIYSTDFVGYLTFTDWKKYDYIDFILLCDVSSISSVVATFNGQDILSDVSWVNNATLGGGYFVQGRLDLSKVDRAINNNPMVMITGTLKTSAQSTSTGSNSFQITDIAGFVSTTVSDPTVYWLQRVYDAVKSGLGGNGQGAVIKDQTQQQAGQISDAVADFGAASKPSSSDVNANLQFSDIVSASALSGSTSFLTALFNVPSLLQVVTLALMLGLLATVIYGKR